MVQWRRAGRWAQDRIGRRGAILLFLTVLDCSYGYAIIASKLPAQKAGILILPWAVWGWLWVATGLTCLVFAFRRNDVPGYNVATALKTAWALAYLWAGLKHLPLWWLSSVVWATFAAAVMVIAGWAEPGRPGRSEGGQ
jgi:hypothetical protein